MKKPFVALLLLVGAAAMVANVAFAQVDGQSDIGNKLVNAKMMQDLLQSRAQNLRTSAGVDPDTVWFGHSYADHWNATSNYWNLYTGSNFPSVSDPTNAIWDWDHSTGLVEHGIGDSLAGWWPMRRVYSTTGGLTWPDNSRPWWALDIGNQANYVMNAGPGGKRTMGVVGIWHADPGTTVGPAVRWSPLSGSKSAWCGLRQHGDNTVVDAVTGNPYNQTTLEWNGEGGPITNPTNKHFPGYPSQMDQILYRDLTPSAGQDLNISFMYRTRMSNGFDAAAATRTGWFHGDPLAVVAGNFISNTGAGPIDSFSVYVGAPVNDAACVYSDGVTRAVYDPQRRWFSEVLRIFEGPTVPYYEIFNTFGLQPADSASATPSASVTVPGAYVDLIRNAPGNTGNKVRLAFRVKTNRGFDDQGAAFTSLGRGAVQIDDVVVNAALIGDFEGAEQSGTNSIDNRTGSSATLNWKSTGKPPAIYFHLRSLSDLVYNDLCGPADSPARTCNLVGTVMTAGNYDDGERAADSRFFAFREVLHAFVSPTINMVAGPTPNAQGLTETIVDVTDDIYIWYDMYAGMFNLSFTGNGWNFGSQDYPARMPNGANCWGDLRFPGFQIFNPEPQCFSDIEGLFGNGLIGTTNPSGVPDSMRIFIGHNQACFRFAVSLGCNSADGAYFDNISVGFVDAPAATQVSVGSTTVGSVTYDIWNVYNDAFPANETPGLASTTAFDTTGAHMKTGINNAPSTGDVTRFDIPGDSLAIIASNVTVTAPDLNATRLDLVFRILPGPGNYQIAAGRTFPLVNTMQLLKVPSNQANVVVSGDNSFWGQYMAAPGAFSAGDHNGGTFWDPLTWNSARCDTTERNLFPTNLLSAGTTTGLYMGMYHELDPKFATLGFDKFRCFVINPASAAGGSNILCNGTVPGYLTALDTLGNNNTGYPGSPLTKEFTKIIPDGLLTPGSHMQYFFRKSAVSGLGTPAFRMIPDTNLVLQSGDSDAHRWQQFSVLPDRWKSVAGAGAACMLYVDNADRRGAERIWVSVMDSIGGTAASKFGAHNGWHQPGQLGNAINATAGYVRDLNQQPGTTWDMYGVKASESVTTGGGSIGGRYAVAGVGALLGKDAKIAPTGEMLRSLYRVLALVSGDLTSGVLGPYANRSQDDVFILNDYLEVASGLAQPRGILINGDGFAQSETQTGGIVPSHTAFLTQKLGLSLRNASYQSVSGNTNLCADLLTTNIISPDGDVYGVSNNCLFSNDLLKRNTGIAEATEATFYEPVGVNAPYAASIYKPSTGLRPWVAMTEGFGQNHILGRYCETTNGRLAYYYNMMNNVFGAICTLTGTPSTTLDVPQNGSGGKFANFMKIGNSVMRAGNANIRFGVSGSDRVKVRLYDVTGRQIRTLADRSFLAGEHSLVWDGSDDSGNQVARGVYFARIEYATKGAPINGRVVVLR